MASRVVFKRQAANPREVTVSSQGSDQLHEGKLPLRARDAGVLERAGHTEAAVDLARLAGCKPAGAICEIMNEDGTMARLSQLEEFSRAHDVKLISVASLIEYRKRTERLVQKTAQTTIPTAYGEWNLHVYESLVDEKHHLLPWRLHELGCQQVQATR